MSVQIHPTAIIDKNAVLGMHVHIGPYSIIGPNVELDDSVYIHSHVVIDGHTFIGEHTEIFPFASIGLAPQDKKYEGEPSILRIGHHNIIREYATMNPGTKGGGMVTQVGNHGLFMVSTHVAHDCIVGDHVIMANHATLAGHVVVGDYAILGGLSAVRQYTRIGAYAMIGGMSAVESDVIPFGMVMNERGNLAGLNLVGLKRRAFSRETIHALRRSYQLLFGQETETESLSLVQKVQYVANLFPHDVAVMELITFLQADGSRSICQPKLSAGFLLDDHDV
jgi:UDP-N-acetylglucosamine acyltransferase